MTANDAITEGSRTSRMLTAMVNHPRRVLIGLVLVTLLLLFAGVATAPEEEASVSPGGEVLDTAETVERTFRPSTTELQFIVEDEGGDALDLATLREWKENSDELRASEELSGAFSTYFDGDLDRTVEGFYTVADAVDDELRAEGIDGGLEDASEAQVKEALAAVLDAEAPTATFRDGLSIDASGPSAGAGGAEGAAWEAPAFLALARVDRSAFPVDVEDESDPATRTVSEQDEIDLARDTEIEQWGRDALETLRGDRENFDAWGVAIDGTLTSDESFDATLPFLFGAIAMIVLLVGGMLRSYWAAALAGAGIALTLLWARMITNIIGFDESIILDVIVPIATISFGVDFLIHAVGRVREHLARGPDHRSAYVFGIASVAGALALALSTSAIALASNATSSIPAVTEFGFGAAIALASAFVVLGILAPLFLLRIEEAIGVDGGRPETRRGRIASALRLLAAAFFAGIAILAVIAAPPVGALLTALYAALAIAVPARRRRRRAAGIPGAERTISAPNTAGESSVRAGRVVSRIVEGRWAMALIVVAITAGAALAATRVERQTEPSDFFPSGSDFVVGIDKLVEHSSSASPGDVYVYLEGEIADPVLLEAFDAADQQVAEQGGELFARNPDGTLTAPDGAIEIARAGLEVAFARRDVARRSGVELTDRNGDGMPDSPEQVQALFAVAADSGIRSDGKTFVYTPDQVAQTVQPVGGGEFATLLRYPMQGFPETATIEEARELVEEAALEITGAADRGGAVVEARVSGDIVAEQVTLDAITDAMVISVPLAMVLCFTVAALAMRSVRLALVSIVPIALVIVWLLGFMGAFDYNINTITATIAAISVGVGIDFSIHYTMRYREQLRDARSRLEAVRIAAEGTGTALVLSGLTSIIGFSVLALAPLPIFAAYGLLTAVMIAFSLAASLIVLPSLLYLLGPKPDSGLGPRPAVPAEPDPLAVPPA
jgi:predicted RND superfamily exporter protein